MLRLTDAFDLPPELLSTIPAASSGSIARKPEPAAADAVAGFAVAG